MTGLLLERGALRYTPAGLEVIEFQLGHRSEQLEAGSPRRVECVMPCIAMGVPARLVNAVGTGQGMLAKGFVAAKSAGNRSVRLHVTEIEIQEGNDNGFQTEERG